MKQHNIIYQTTNLLSGKTYIGRHCTDNLDDGYLGSGTKLLEEIKRLGPDVFERIVLFDFDNPAEMIAKEIELLTEEFVGRPDTYNITIGGSGGMLGMTHNKATREKLRAANVGLVMVKDDTGNCFKISIDDSRYLSGELKHNTHGTVAVKDKDGNKFRVKMDDPRYLSGELVSVNTGTKQSAERVARQVEYMKEYWKTNTHSDEARAKMVQSNLGRVVVKDADGNKLKVSVDDPRYTSGELINAFIGTKLSDDARKKISENKKGCVWVSNTETEKTKLVRPEEVDKYISDGWIRYRMFFNKTK